MKYQFPKIELKEPERIWLTAVYSKLKGGETTENRVLRAELWNKLPRRFDPFTIDRRPIFNGNEITLLGIWHLSES
jgi:hypothetical protein